MDTVVTKQVMTVDMKNTFHLRISYIEAMGGKLDIVAHFPDGDIHINLFKGIDSIKKRIVQAVKK